MIDKEWIWDHMGFLLYFYVSPPLLYSGRLVGLIATIFFSFLYGEKKNE
jgi:hypothetical protein